MSEKANFAIRLIDRITAPARRASASLSRITRAARRARVATATVGRGFFGSIRDVNRAAGAAGQKISEMWSGFSRTPVGFLLGKATQGIFRLGQAIFRTTVSAAKLGATLGVVVAGAITGLTVKMGVFAERSRKAFSFMMGNAEQGAIAFERSRALARDLSLDVENVTNSLISMKQQGFKFSEAETFVKLTADLRAVGASAEQVKSAIRAITQVRGKGKLSSEELRQQLGEAGVSAARVVDKFAEMEGITSPKALKMLESGQIGAEKGLEAIKRAIKEQVGITEAGEAAREFATTTTAGLIQTLKVAPKSLFLDISDRISEMDSVRDSLRDIIRLVDMPVSGREGVAAFVDKMLQGLRGLVKLSVAFFEGFGSGFNEITDSIDFGKPSKKTLEFARGAGAKLADFFAALPKIIGVAFDAINGFARGLGLDQFITDANASISKMDFESMGRKAEDVAMRIGRFIRTTFKELASDNEIFTSVGSRIGGAVVKGIIDAIRDIDWKRIVFNALQDAASVVRDVPRILTGQKLGEDIGRKIADETGITSFFGGLFGSDEPQPRGIPSSMATPQVGGNSTKRVNSNMNLTVHVTGDGSAEDKARSFVDTAVAGLSSWVDRDLAEALGSS